jgi:hypothetical protein
VTQVYYLVLGEREGGGASMKGSPEYQNSRIKRSVDIIGATSLSDLDMVFEPAEKYAHCLANSRMNFIVASKLNPSIEP